MVALIAVAVLLVLTAPLQCAEANWAASVEETEKDDPDAIVLPIKDGKRSLGDIKALLDETGARPALNKADLRRVLTPVLKDETLAQIEGHLGQAAYIPIADINAAGLSARFDAATLEIYVMPTVPQRERRPLYVRSRGAISVPAQQEKAAALSGFVNMKVSGGVQRSTGGKQAQLAPGAALEGAVRWRGAVLESSANVSADGLPAFQGTRLVYDRPETATRFTAGRVQMVPGGFLSWPALRGVSVQKSYQTLQPAKDIRPTGRRSFRLDRDADVELHVNGVPVRRLALGAGEYDLDELPLTNGTNAVRLVVKGESATDPETYLDFSIPFNRILLAPGIHEWSAVLGDAGDGVGRAIEAPVAAGTYRRGMKEDITVSVSGEFSASRAAINANAVLETPFGLVSIDSAASLSMDNQFGAALGAIFEVKRTSSDTPMLISAAWIDGGWKAAPFEKARDDRFELSLARGFEFSDSLHSTISLDAVVDDTATIGGALALNKRLNESVTASLFGIYLTPLTGNSKGDSDSLLLLGRLQFQLGEDSDLALTRSNTGTPEIAFSQDVHTGAAQWSLDTLVQPHGESGHEASGRLAVTTSTIEASLSHDRAFQRFGSGKSKARTTVAAAAGIAFADGSVAVGRPVRGAFAIVKPHEELQAATLKVNGHQGVVLGSSVLVGNLPAYAMTRVLYDFDGLPDDAVTGAGAFNLEPGYRSGHALTAGSGVAASVTGIVNTRMDEPLALLSIQLRASESGALAIDGFTDEEGRFAIDGVRPGHWTLVVASTPPTTYDVTVAVGARGQINLGVLKPKETG